ncbi:hypothetical protein AVDCRST_MAG94-4716 [uncultured Leptolyngbya sp.]|uniref:Uncharacterized protein n=1 Tax=uncultured Leptolyngbya sp. TaxID=332963 RepID=A0A6J4N918_9CYAN|nr:hypothetical protein AVDCRST_MAG94-4716 [uncultured Leptolyngbya sp.]
MQAKLEAEGYSCSNHCWFVDEGYSGSTYPTRKPYFCNKTRQHE